ncbi:MAG: hypothetical protein Q8S31_00975 [Alphaproteobacteria bacterium]|nr:hypothetical protein [Alphaproteobacteria bacterium]
MLRKSFLTTIAAVAFSTALTPVFAGGTGDMGHRPAPVYHPAAPVEVPTQVIRSCEGPALREGQWTLTARAGIALSASNRKGRVRQRFVDHETSIVTHANTYDVHHHNVPFTAGVDLGYVPMDNVEVFFNFDYANASGSKHRHVRRSISDPAGTYYLSTRYKQDNFNSYGFYLGGRYFFEIDDCKFSPFIGGKLGVLNRSNGKHRVTTIITQNNAEVLNASYKAHHNKDSTGFSGGVQAGLDYCINDPVSLFVMAEAIGTTRSNTHRRDAHVFTDTAGNRLYSRATRSSGGTFTFPITAGIKVRM